MVDLLCAAVSLYVFAIIGRAILSWFPIGYDSPLAGVVSILESATEPVLGPVRRSLPPLGGFDLSPIVVIIGLQIIASVLLGC